MEEVFLADGSSIAAGQDATEETLGTNRRLRYRLYWLTASLCLFSILLVILSLASLKRYGSLTWNSQEIIFGTALAITLVITALIRTNLWWLNKNQLDDPLQRKFFILVFTVSASAALIGVASTQGLSHGAAAILSGGTLVLGVVLAYYLRRSE